MKSVNAHIANCITFNLPIDRALLSEREGLTGPELESFIHKNVTAFCYISQGKTGTPAAANAPRRGKHKTGERT